METFLFNLRHDVCVWVCAIFFDQGVEALPCNSSLSADDFTVDALVCSSGKRFKKEGYIMAELLQLYSVTI